MGLSRVRLAKDVVERELVADNLDLEIGFAVAIGVAFQKEEADIVHPVKFAGLVMERLAA